MDLTENVATSFQIPFEFRRRPEAEGTVSGPTHYQYKRRGRIIIARAPPGGRRQNY